MAIFVGVHPGGINRFAVSALFYDGRLPALCISSSRNSGVNDVVNDILGVFGEWGELGAVAIDAPLTWSGNQSGWRDADDTIRSLLPSWAPNSWLRSPNTLPGAIAVQGPALTWALALEHKKGLLPAHEVYECHPRLGWANVARDIRDHVLQYRDRGVPQSKRHESVGKLLRRLTTCGVVRFESTPPKNEDEVDATLCALAALGLTEKESGILVDTYPGGEIRPVGKRVVSVLKSFP